MRWNEPLTLRVRVISPVVIGTGEKCNTMGFLAGDNIVLVVDEHRFVAALNESERDLFVSQLEQLAGNLAHLRQQIQRARDNQQLRNRLNQQRRQAEEQLSLVNFLRQTLRMRQPGEWLRQHARAVRYEVKALSVPNRYEGFAFCLKTPDYHPYIPGSELKGAMKTAVLSALLHQNGALLSNLQSQLQGLQGNPRQLQQQLRDLWQTTEHGLLRSGKPDAHYDLLRGISISDSEPLPTSALQLYEAKRLGMSRRVSVFTEAIAPNSETTTTLSIAKPDRWLREMGLMDKAGWLNWSKLAQALYEHANAVLDFIAFIAQKFPEVRQRANALKSQNTPNAPLVCVGWGQGFLSVTMTDPLRQKHPNAYEALRKAMAQAIRQYGRTKPNNFPKTIWVALDDSRNPVPFGWLKLIPK